MATLVSVGEHVRSVAVAFAFALVSAVVVAGAQFAVAVVETGNRSAGFLVVYLADLSALALVLTLLVAGVFEKSTKSRTTQWSQLRGIPDFPRMTARLEKQDLRANSL